VNLHWATTQLSPPLIDYVIVHELAHVHEPNHTLECWQRVERAIPHFQRSKEMLARKGCDLWLGDSPSRG
jgi:predicted metal-dependent hydrolase